MIALYVILIVLAVIGFLLFSSVSIMISTKDGVKVKCRYLFVTYSYPAKKVSKPKNKQMKSTENKAPEKENAFKRLINSEGLSGTLTLIFDVLKQAAESLGNLLHHVRVKRFNLKIKVASDDPMMTAVEYGTVCSLVYPALSFFYGKCKFKRKKTEINVISDFNVTKPDIEFSAKFKCRLIFVIAAGIKVIIPIIRKKIVGKIVSGNLKNQTVTK
jgi:hypothetical protein